jgi:TRAP-type C4-dicarboxylate transport system substrate-binding protein
MAKWNSLPKDVKKVMDALRVEQAEWTGKYMDEHVNKSIAWSKENYKIQIYDLPPAEMALWNGKMAPIIAKWVENATAKGLPGAAIVDDMKASAKKYRGK